MELTDKLLSIEDLKKKVSDILGRALAGYRDDYKINHADGRVYVAWGTVERDIHAAVENTSHALNYYKTAALQSNHGSCPRPKYIPKRVLVLHTVSSDIPGGPRIGTGEYDVECNPLGAVSVKTTSGKMLGLRLSEFEVLEWCKNPHYHQDKSP